MLFERFMFRELGKFKLGRAVELSLNRNPPCHTEERQQNFYAAQKIYKGQERDWKRVVLLEVKFCVLENLVVYQFTNLQKKFI